MMANGVSASQTATPPPFANPTSPIRGIWEYGSQTGSPWGYAAQTYDPRYNTPITFDPRFGVPMAAYDPRSNIGPFGARFGTPPVDPRFGATLPPYDPRFEPPVFGWGLDQSIPAYDPRLFNWGAAPTPVYGFDGQPLTPGGFYGFPARGPEAFYPQALRPAGPGFGELPRFSGPVTPRFGFMGGLPKDEEIEEMAQEALDRHPMIPLDADVDVRCESGQVSLTGKVPDKRIKRAAGEAVWWIPGVTDVNNSIVVSGRRQAQATRRRGRQTPVQAAR